MAIEKLDYATEVIEALQGAYRQDWCLTNWTGTGKPLLPAGMIISILGYPYLVSGGDETPADPASDGAVYLKVTPDAPAGATATAEYVNTFSGTWSEAYNGFYDGDSLFLNVFMTKTGANWTAKGTWLNFRERKLALISDGLSIGNLIAVDGTFSGDINSHGNLVINPLVTVGSEIISAIPSMITSFYSSYTKIVEKKANFHGDVNIHLKFSAWANLETSNGTSYARIYKNGIAIGTQRSASLSGAGETISETTEQISVQKDDLIQLYVYRTGNTQHRTHNFDIQVSQIFSEIVLDYIVI